MYVWACVCYLSLVSRYIWKKIGEASGASERHGRMTAGVYKERSKGFFLRRSQEEMKWVRRPGNTPIREPMSDGRFTDFILAFS